MKDFFLEVFTKHPLKEEKAFLKQLKIYQNATGGFFGAVKDLDFKKIKSIDGPKGNKWITC